MPFELGLVLGDSLDHHLLVLERQPLITKRVLSDVNGLDCCSYVKAGDIIGAISDKLYKRAAPSKVLICRLHESMIKAARQILRDYDDLYGARAFELLVLAAQSTLSTLHVTQGAS